MFNLYFLCWTTLATANVLKYAQAKVVTLNITANDMHVIRKDLFVLLKTSYNSIQVMNKELHDLTVTVKKLSLISKNIEGNSYCLNIIRSTRVIHDRNVSIIFSKCIKNDISTSSRLYKNSNENVQY